MQLTPTDIAKLDAEAIAIRDTWDEGDQKRAAQLVRQAEPMVLASLRIRSTVDPELKLVVDREQYRRCFRD